MTWDPYTFETPTRAALVSIGVPAEALHSVWLQPTLDGVVAALEILPDDRDRPADPEAALEALEFLAIAAEPDTAPPLVAPLNDGGIQIEWHRGGIDVEVVFSTDPEERGIWVRDQETRVEEEGDLDPGLFRELVGNRLLAN